MREAINEINELLRYLIDAGGSIEAELIARRPAGRGPGDASVDGVLRLRRQRDRQNYGPRAGAVLNDCGGTIMAISDGGRRRVIWSDEDGAYVGLCDEYPSLSWLDATPDEALAGIRRLVDEAILDL